jgi:signal transduction histidine kinase
VRLTADAATRAAILSIADTGTGIESSNLPRVFEPFIQAEQSLDREA